MLSLPLRGQKQEGLACHVNRQDQGPGASRGEAPSETGSQVWDYITKWDCPLGHRGRR